MKLFQYAIVFHEKLAKAQLDEGKTPQHIILKDISSVMARDEREVLLKAAREIAPEYTDKLDQIEIAVRPF